MKENTLFPPRLFCIIIQSAEQFGNHFSNLEARENDRDRECELHQNSGQLKGGKQRVYFGRQTRIDRERNVLYLGRRCALQCKGEDGMCRNFSTCFRLYPLLISELGQKNDSNDTSTPILHARTRKIYFGLRVEVFETPLTPGLAPEDTDKFLHYDSLAQSRKTREMNWRD